MTRKEERVNYAMSFKGKGIENEEVKEIVRLAILDGAVWADKTMIEKVCKFIREYCNTSEYNDYGETHVESYAVNTVEDLIEDLCKAIDE